MATNVIRGQFNRSDACTLCGVTQAEFGGEGSPGWAYCRVYPEGTCADDGPNLCCPRCVYLGAATALMGLDGKFNGIPYERGIGPEDWIPYMAELALTEARSMTTDGATRRAYREGLKRLRDVVRHELMQKPSALFAAHD